MWLFGPMCVPVACMQMANITHGDVFLKKVARPVHWLKVEVRANMQHAIWHAAMFLQACINAGDIAYWQSDEVHVCMHINTCRHAPHRSARREYLLHAGEQQPIGDFFCLSPCGMTGRTPCHCPSWTPLLSTVRVRCPFFYNIFLFACMSLFEPMCPSDVKEGIVFFKKESHSETAGEGASPFLFSVPF